MSVPIRRDGPPSHVQVFRPPAQQDAGAADRARWYKRKAWLDCRKHKLSLSPLCELCRERGEFVSATQVHHIRDLAAFPDLGFVLSNLQSLCRDCHSRITMGRNHDRWRNADASQTR
jgi:5-methylcytosine-specific restriction endonuclease McrA